MTYIKKGYRTGEEHQGSKPVRFQGKNLVPRELAKLSEAGVGETIIRVNLNRMIETVGEEKYTDEDVLKCIKRKPKGKIPDDKNNYYRKRLNKKKEKEKLTFMELEDILNKGMKANVS